MKQVRWKNEVDQVNQANQVIQVNEVKQVYQMNQWQFWIVSQRYWWGPLQKFHWPVNDSFDKYTFQVKPGIILISGLLIGQEHKIERSHWLRGQSMKNQRVYPFIFSVHQNCHWLVNDNFEACRRGTDGDLYRSVIDQSMTVFRGLQNVRSWTLRVCHWHF